MTGDERFPEPGPVAEYRDPELVRRFDREVPPQHEPGFWSDLEAHLGAAGPEVGWTDGASGNDLAGFDDTVQLLPGPIEMVPASAQARRWGTGRLLTVAAASLAVLGVGAAIVIGQSGPSSPVESATPATDPDVAQADEPSEEGLASTTVTTAPATTTTATPSSTTAPALPPQATIDYFEGDVQIDSIGPGSAVGFSPDDAAVLVVDDAPGVASGCEGTEVKALYVQMLATGERRPAMEGEPPIEAGGLRLAVDPFGSTPAEVGTRPVYGQELCDGVSDDLWRGVLSSDGRISMLEPVAAGGPKDPFAGGPPRSGRDLALLSPDVGHLLQVDHATVKVLGIDGDGDGEADGTVAKAPNITLDDPVEGVVWSPDGQAVALSTAEGLLLWSPWTGASQRLPSGPAVDVIFNRAGDRLAFSGGGGITVLSFGDGPAPVAAPPRCSGRTAFRPLSTTALIDQGLPKVVANTVSAIDDAAASCDWAALDRLAPDDLVSSLGGDDPVAFWSGSEAAGGSPMWYLRTLFRQPNVVESVDPRITYLWPAIDQDDDCTLDDDERASVIALGMDPVAAENACVVGGGYAGYRTSIGDDGVWRSFHLGTP